MDSRSLLATSPERKAGSLDEGVRGGLRAYQDSVARERQKALAPRQVRIGGRTVTVLGDSAAGTRGELRADIVGRKPILPSDGREWEQLQLTRQEQDLERDRAFRERVRSTRERRQAERGADPT